MHSQAWLSVSSLHQVKIIRVEMVRLPVSLGNVMARATGTLRIFAVTARGAHCWFWFRLAPAMRGAQKCGRSRGARSAHFATRPYRTRISCLAATSGLQVYCTCRTQIALWRTHQPGPQAEPAAHIAPILCIYAKASVCFCKAAWSEHDGVRVRFHG